MAPTSDINCMLKLAGTGPWGPRPVIQGPQHRHGDAVGATGDDHQARQRQASHSHAIQRSIAGACKPQQRGYIPKQRHGIVQGSEGGSAPVHCIRRRAVRPNQRCSHTVQVVGCRGQARGSQQGLVLVQRHQKRHEVYRTKGPQKHDASQVPLATQGAGWACPWLMMVDV